MTKAELIALARLTLDDTAGEDEDRRWSDAELEGYLWRAEWEACLRASLIVDTTTEQTCKITVTADEATYALDPAVIRVDRAKLASKPAPLIKKTSGWLDDNIYNWESVAGDPKYFIQDSTSGGIRIISTPQADDVLWMRVIRGPLDEDDESPEIPEHHHEKLLQWVYHLAYSKLDEDAHNPKLAEITGSMFAGYFGQRPSAGLIEERRRESRRRTKAHFF